MLKKINTALFILISFLIINSTRPLLSQTIDESVKEKKAEITGTVIDEFKMPLAGVFIYLTSKKTGITLTAITSENGKFRFVGLIPHEKYELKADLSGFAKVAIDEISITTAGNIDEISQIDFTGGMRIIDLKSRIIEEGPSPTTRQIHRISINENSGLDPINRKEVPIDKSAFYYAFYYLNQKIFAEQGIAEIGVVEKNLSNITEVPYKNEDYANKELYPQEKYVYSIRIGEGENRRLLLIRIIKINENRITIEYLVGD